MKGELTFAELPADRTEDREYYRVRAQKILQIGDQVRLTDDGAWVEAWVFIPKPDHG